MGLGGDLGEGPRGWELEVGTIKQTLRLCLGGAGADGGLGVPWVPGHSVTCFTCRGAVLFPNSGWGF